MEYERKIDYHEMVDLLNNIGTIKKAVPANTLLLAKASKKIFKVFEDIDNEIKEEIEESKGTKTTVPYPKASKEKRKIILTRQQLQAFGEFIVDYLNNDEITVSLKLRMIEIADSLMLSRFLDKHCEVDKVKEIEIDDETLLSDGDKEGNEKE